MKRYKTSAIMRAIVADASIPGEQRDAASRVLTKGNRSTWRALYNEVPFSMATACGWSHADDRRRLAWGDPARVQAVHDDPARVQAVHDDLVKIARHYGIQPTEDA